MQDVAHTISTPSGPMGVHVVHPEGDGPFPVVVFFHHGQGLEEGSKQTMAHIAEWGYYVVSHDRYHRHKTWYTRSANDDIEKIMTMVQNTTEDQVAEDLRAVLAWLPSQPLARCGAMACVGHCIGGRSALRTIEDHGAVFRAAVALHPSFCTTDQPDSPHLGVASYTGSLYIGLGSADTKQPVSANGPLIEAANALDKGEAEVHDGADHGFGVFGPSFHEAAATRSYARAKIMLDRELQN